MIRITFQLDTSLAKAFDEYSTRHHLPKAVLLRDWLDHIEQVRFFKKDYTAEVTTYHFRLEEETVLKLDQRAKALSISRSALLRNLIKTGLLMNKQHPEITDDYLMQKTYPEIAHMLSSYPEPPIEMLLLEARANFEIGPIDIPSIRSSLLKIQIMSERHPKNYKISAQIKLLEAQLFLTLGDNFHALERFNEAKMIAYANGDYVFLSDIYYLLGLAQHLARDIQGALQTYENALEYITIQNNPFRVARLYMHIAVMYMLQRDFNNAQRYLARSKKKFSSQKTPHYFTIYQSIEGFFYFLQGDLEQAKTKLIDSYNSFQKMKSFFGMYCSAQGLGRIYLLTGQLDQAQEIFHTITIQEQALSQTFSQTNAPLFLSYLEIENRYEEAVNTMKKVIDMKKPYAKVEIEEYILACGLYIYGKNDHDNKEGQNILETLAKKGATELLQNAAKETLKHKKMYPVTVI